MKEEDRRFLEDIWKLVNEKEQIDMVIDALYEKEGMRDTSACEETGGMQQKHVVNLERERRRTRLSLFMGAACIVLLLGALGLFGLLHPRQDTASSGEDQEAITFEASVINCNDKNLLVHTIEPVSAGDTKIFQSMEPVSVSCDGNNNYNTGDLIEVTFDGMILESYPAQITAGGVKKLEDASGTYYPPFKNLYSGLSPSRAEDMGYLANMDSEVLNLDRLDSFMSLTADGIASCIRVVYYSNLKGGGSAADLTDMAAGTENSSLQLSMVTDVIYDGSNYVYYSAQIGGEGQQRGLESRKFKYAYYFKEEGVFLLSDNESQTYENLFKEMLSSAVPFTDHNNIILWYSQEQAAAEEKPEHAMSETELDSYAQKQTPRLVITADGKASGDEQTSVACLYYCTQYGTSTFTELYTTTEEDIFNKGYGLDLPQNAKVQLVFEEEPEEVTIRKDFHASPLYSYSVVEDVEVVNNFFEVNYYFSKRSVDTQVFSRWFYIIRCRWANGVTAEYIIPVDNEALRDYEFTEEETAEAEQVVRDCVEAQNAKDIDRVLACWSDEIAGTYQDNQESSYIGKGEYRLKELSCLETSLGRASYILNGRGSTNGAVMKNVIVLKADVILDGQLNPDWTYTLIREDENSPWKIDDNGY